MIVLIIMFWCFLTGVHFRDTRHDDDDDDYYDYDYDYDDDDNYDATVINCFYSMQHI